MKRVGMRLGPLAATVVVLGLVAAPPASSAAGEELPDLREAEAIVEQANAGMANEAMTAVGDGYWVGHVHFQCSPSGTPGILSCNVSGGSDLCIELVVGTTIGGPCEVNFSGTLLVSAGVSPAHGPGVCTGVGFGSVSISSNAGGYTFGIVIGALPAGGGFVGKKTSLPTADAFGIWGAICNDTTIAPASGRYSIQDLGPLG